MAGSPDQRGRWEVDRGPPIALGHAAAIAMALGVLALGNATLGGTPVRWIAAGVLAAFGLAKPVRHRHPRWVGMRVGFGGLFAWSFLMATAHGAGLMVMPLFIAGSGVPACHVRAGIVLAGPTDYLGAIFVHTAAMLLVAGAIALVVYYKLGLSLLRRAWFNLDRLWAAALVVSGVSALFV